MANCYYHSVSSVKKDGVVNQKTTNLSMTGLMNLKKIIAHWSHRALRHHAEGCFAAEQKFGTSIKNSDGKMVPVRLIAERHIVEDMGWIPSFYDWAILIKPTKWTMKGYRNVGQDN